MKLGAIKGLPVHQLPVDRLKNISISQKSNGRKQRELELPTIFTVDGFRFFFFSNEGREPMHVHIEKGEKYSKVWMRPISLAYNYKFNGPELGRIIRIIENHFHEIEEAWNEYFNIH